LVSVGRRTDEIAEVLGLCEETVRSYLKKVQGKLGVRNRAHAAAEVVRPVDPLRGHGGRSAAAEFQEALQTTPSNYRRRIARGFWHKKGDQPLETRVEGLGVGPGLVPPGRPGAG
jgi:hypothetical protein